MFKFIIHFTLLIGCLNLAWGTALSFASTTSENKSLTSILASKPFIKTGEASFSFLFWDIYRSQLQTTSGRYPIAIEREQLIFQIHYFTEISNDNLIMRTVEQWQHQGISKDIYHQYIEKLTTIWPNIEKGDRLAMLMQKNKSSFYFNDQYIGAINDNVFGQLFINIWLDQSTSEPSLRAQLLGESNAK